MRPCDPLSFNGGDAQADLTDRRVPFPGHPTEKSQFKNELENNTKTWSTASHC